jgi:integrase
MATIRTVAGKKGTRYSAQIRIRGYTESKTFTTKTAAKSWAKKREVELKEKPHLAASEAHKHTLADAIDRYVQDHLPALSTSAQKNQRTQLNWWRQEYGHLSLEMLQAPVLAEARDRLLKRRKPDGSIYAPATTVRYLMGLGTVLRTAVKEWHWIPSNPITDISKPKVENARVRFLSDEEIPRLLDACRESESAHLYTVVRMLLTTGARKMEILGLDWRDIDFATSIVTLRDTKNGDVRTVHLDGEVAEILQARRGIAGLVFPGPRKPSQPADITVAWRSALRRAGIKDFHLHDLRHSHASFLAMEGVSPLEIATVLGHRQLSMVKRYSHLAPEHVAAVSAKVSAKLEGK